MQSCFKRYHDIPFAHRQHRHDGHCAYIHGHNWSFEFEFRGQPSPETDFIVDFGGATMKRIKNDIEEFFDHSCILNESDNEGIALASTPGLFKLRLVPSCSAEGIARFLFARYSPWIFQDYAGRAHLESIRVYEDSRNSAYLHRSDTL